MILAPLGVFLLVRIDPFKHQQQWLVKRQRKDIELKKLVAAVVS
jgi:hypothetical protein